LNDTLDTSTPRSSRRRPALVAAVVAVVAVVVALVLLITGGSDDAQPDTAAAATSAAPTSAAPTTAAPTGAAPTSAAPVAVTPEPSGPTSDADEPPPSLSPVALDQPAAVGNGITARIVSMEGIDAAAVGPGNVSGPALRVSVELTNGTTGAVSLDGVAVDLASGPELVPASPVDDASAAPFHGSVPAGGTAQGVYVFTISPADRTDVTLSVGYEAGAPFLVFTGAAR
jgi:hypothetical protein